MILTNCNGSHEIACNLNLRFDYYETGLVGLLSVKNLVADVSLTQYVIDWYANGVKVLTTGKSRALDSTIEKEHPFYTEGYKLPIIVTSEYVDYVPRVRYIITNSGTYYSSPQPCRDWCNDFNTLPTIRILELACDVDCGNASADYSCKISYNAAVNSDSTRSKIVTVKINSQSAYIAMNFYGKVEYDTITVSYVDISTGSPIKTLLEKYRVGTGVVGSSDLTDPKQIDSISEKIIANFTDKEYYYGNYIEIEISPNEAYTTIWDLEIKCLSVGAFDSACALFPSTTPIPANSIRDIELDSPAPSLVHSTADCSYTLTLFMKDTLYQEIQASNLGKYLNIRSIFNNVVSYTTTEPDKGKIEIKLFDAHYFTGPYPFQANEDYKVPNKRYSYVYDNNSTLGLHRFTWVFYSEQDYTTYGVNRYTNIMNSTAPGGSMYYNSTDKTSPWYYRLFYQRWRTSPINYSPNSWDDSGIEVPVCGDQAGSQSVMFFHPSSVVSYPADNAELIFTAKVAGVSFTDPVVTMKSGDLYAAVIKKRVNGTTLKDNNIPPNNISQKQITTIIFSGTSGTVEISAAGGLTKTVTFRDNLRTTVADFVSPTNITDYNNVGIALTCTQEQDYIRTVTIDYYTGLKNDFDTYFKHPEDEIIRCNNVWTLLNGFVNSIQGTINSPSFSGSSGCINTPFFNGYVVYEVNSPELYKNAFIYQYLTLQSLNTVCPNFVGWQRFSDATYRFYILSIKVEFTHLEYESEIPQHTSEEIKIHRERNWKVSSYLVRDTGEILTVPIKIFELENGDVI